MATVDNKNKPAQQAQQSQAPRQEQKGDAAPKEKVSKSKRARFEEYAAKRTRTALQALETLSNCGNRNTYEYSEAEAAKIVTAIRKKVDELEEAFKPKGVGTKDAPFTL